jgi:hypothetical protein
MISKNLLKILLLIVKYEVYFMGVHKVAGSESNALLPSYMTSRYPASQTIGWGVSATTNQ